MGHAKAAQEGEPLQQARVTGTSASPRSLDRRLLLRLGRSVPEAWSMELAAATCQIFPPPRHYLFTLSAGTRSVLSYPDSREEGSRQTLLHQLAQGVGPQGGVVDAAQHPQSLSARAFARRMQRALERCVIEKQPQR